MGVVSSKEHPIQSKVLLNYSFNQVLLNQVVVILGLFSNWAKQNLYPHRFFLLNAEKMGSTSSICLSDSMVLPTIHAQSLSNQTNCKMLPLIKPTETGKGQIDY